MLHHSSCPLHSTNKQQQPVYAPCSHCMEVGAAMLHLVSTLSRCMHTLPQQLPLAQHPQAMQHEQSNRERGHSDTCRKI